MSAVLSMVSVVRGLDRVGVERKGDARRVLLDGEQKLQKSHDAAPSGLRNAGDAGVLFDDFGVKRP